MRLGFDAGKALAPRDGIGRYARELLRALAGLDAGLEFELFGLPREAGEGAARELLGGKPPAGVHSGWRVEPGAVDVFHSTAWNVPATPAVPTLFTCHDLTFLTHPACHTLDNRVHCLGGLLRANLDGARFLAVSRATAGSLRRELGIEADRIAVVHHAPSPDLRPLPREEARRRLGERWGIGGAPVLAVGTLEPRKNLARLLDAYAGLDAGLRRAHPLIVAGGGGWKNASLLARLGDLETARRLDPQGDADLSLLYSAAAVFAYPSLAEGFGLPVVEAMACGAPVVTSNVSSLPEVAGDASRLVDPLDVADIRRALDELLRDPGERRRLRDLGRLRAQSFSWTETARRTLALYRRLSPGAAS